MTAKAKHKELKRAVNEMEEKRKNTESNVTRGVRKRTK